MDYSIMSGVDHDPLSQAGGRREKISYMRNGKRITYTRKKRAGSRKNSRRGSRKNSRRGSRKKSRSRSRSRSRSTPLRIRPGTRGWPTLANVDQYSSDMNEIRKTLRGETRYLEFEDGEYFWIRRSRAAKSKNLSKGVAKKMGMSVGDMMAMYAYMKKNKAESRANANNMPVPNVTPIQHSVKEWNQHSQKVEKLVKTVDFLTNKQMNLCITSIQIDGDGKPKRSSLIKNTFGWKGDVKNGDGESCQNVMLYGIVDDVRDVDNFSFNNSSTFGREICRILYNNNRPVSKDRLQLNHNSIDSLLNTRFRSSSKLNLIVFQKESSGKVHVYVFGESGAIAPRMFLKSNDTGKAVDVSSTKFYTLPDGDNKSSQLHIVAGNGIFMQNATAGFMSWLTTNNRNKLTPRNISPKTCRFLAETIAKDHKDKDIVTMYAVIDEQFMDRALDATNIARPLPSAPLTEKATDVLPPPIGTPPPPRFGSE